MKIVMIGMQGCGKGTQAQKISRKYNIPHISTGDMFREAMSKETPMGLIAKEYVNNGKLVPDEITTNLVRERIAQPDCVNGFILDGYPRNLSQLQDYYKDNSFDYAVFMDVDEEVVINRIKSRRTCEKCGKVYSTQTYSNPTCECGGNLIVREDEKALDERIRIYKEQTFPLISFFEEKGILARIDVKNLKETEPEKQIEEVFNKITNILGE